MVTGASPATRNAAAALGSRRARVPARARMNGWCREVHKLTLSTMGGSAKLEVVWRRRTRPRRAAAGADEDDEILHLLRSSARMAHRGGRGRHREPPELLGLARGGRNRRVSPAHSGGPRELGLGLGRGIEREEMNARGDMDADDSSRTSLSAREAGKWSTAARRRRHSALLSGERKKKGKGKGNFTDNPLVFHEITKPV